MKVCPLKRKGGNEPFPGPLVTLGQSVVHPEIDTNRAKRMGNTLAVRMGGPKGVAVNTYSKEFKLEALRRMKTCKTISSLAKELGVGRKFLYKWREQLRTEG